MANLDDRVHRLNENLEVNALHLIVMLHIIRQFCF